MDIYSNYIHPVGQTAIDNAVTLIRNAPTAYLILAYWETEAWEDITTGIINYVNDVNNSLLDTEVPITLLGSSGKVGFTEDSKFSFTLDPALALNESCSIDLGQSVLTLKYVDKDIVNSLYPELDSSPGHYNPATIVELVGTELKYVLVRHAWNDSRSFSAGTYTSLVFDGNFEQGLRFSSGANLFKNTWELTRAGYYDSTGNFYTVTQKDGKYCFLNYFDNTTKYKNLTFDSQAQVIVWLADQAGLKVSISDETSDPADYQVKDKTPVITGDTAAAQTKSNTIVDGADADTGTITTALPTTDELLDVVAANPDIILEPEKAATLDVPVPVKPADLPDINTEYPLWQTKFPFCLPWDLYRLFSGFLAEEETPVFTFIMMPENSFGLHNEEISLTVDFSQYGLDKVVKIVRCFTYFGFVYGLIIITRKIIGAEG